MLALSTPKHAALFISSVDNVIIPEASCFCVLIGQVLLLLCYWLPHWLRVTEFLWLSEAPCILFSFAFFLGFCSHPLTHPSCGQSQTFPVYKLICLFPFTSFQLLLFGNLLHPLYLLQLMRQVYDSSNTLFSINSSIDHPSRAPSRTRQ